MLIQSIILNPGYLETSASTSHWDVRELAACVLSRIIRYFMLLCNILGKLGNFIHYFFVPKCRGIKLFASISYYGFYMPPPMKKYPGFHKSTFALKNSKIYLM